MNYRFYISAQGGHLGWIFWRNSVVLEALPPLFKGSKFACGLFGKTLWGFLRVLDAPTERQRELWLQELSDEWQPTDTEWPPYGEQ